MNNPILHNAPKILILTREDMIKPAQEPQFLIGMDSFPHSIIRKFQEATIVLFIDDDDIFCFLKNRYSTGWGDIGEVIMNIYNINK